MNSASTTKHQLYRALVLIFFTYLAAAFFSQGALDGPEHFSILEAANYKLGLSPKESLPDTVALKSQSWLLPAIAFGVAKLVALYDFNPFCVALTLRLIATLLGIFATLSLMRAGDGWLSDYRIKRATFFALGLVWFLPVLNARFSAEGISRSLFLLGFIPLVLSVQEGRRASLCTGWVSGLLLALAFEAHYWSAFLILPGLIWFLIYGKSSIQVHARVKGGFLLGLLAVAFLNRWGYGHATFPAAPYFFQHLFLKRVAGETAPWWNYFVWLITEFPPVWGLSLILGSVWAWYQKPKLSLTWVTAVYFLSLLLYSPRALVDLSPLAPLSLLVIALALQKARETRPDLLDVAAFRFLGTILIVTNALALVYATFSPAREEVSLYRSVWKNSAPAIYSLEGDPYKLEGRDAFFYRRPDLQVNANVTQYDLDKKIQEEGPGLYATAHLFEEGGIYLRSHPNCKPLDAQISHWIVGTDLERLIRRHWRPWALFFCRK